MNKFFIWFERALNKLDWSHVESANPFEWLDLKSNFDDNKKKKYRN